MVKDLYVQKQMKPKSITCQLRYFDRKVGMQKIDVSRSIFMLLPNPPKSKPAVLSLNAKRVDTDILVDLSIYYSSFGEAE